MPAGVSRTAPCVSVTDMVVAARRTELPPWPWPAPLHHRWKNTACTHRSWHRTHAHMPTHTVTQSHAHGHTHTHSIFSKWMTCVRTYSTRTCVHTRHTSSCACTVTSARSHASTTLTHSAPCLATHTPSPRPSHTHTVTKSRELTAASRAQSRTHPVLSLVTHPLPY